jgi:hypothetical protein
MMLTSRQTSHPAPHRRSVAQARIATRRPSELATNLLFFAALGAAVIALLAQYAGF